MQIRAPLAPSGGECMELWEAMSSRVRPDFDHGIGGKHTVITHQIESRAAR